MIDQKSISIFLFLSQKNKKLKIYKSTFKSTFKKGGAKIIKNNNCWQRLAPPF
jgi:hypothetical protein